MMPPPKALNREYSHPNIQSLHDEVRKEFERYYEWRSIEIDKHHLVGDFWMFFLYKKKRLAVRWQQDNREWQVSRHCGMPVAHNVDLFTALTIYGELCGEKG